MHLLISHAPQLVMFLVVGAGFYMYHKLKGE